MTSPTVMSPSYEKLILTSISKNKEYTPYYTHT